MLLKIRKVDPYGFCGREHHPQASDEGLTVAVLAMASEFGQYADTCHTTMELEPAAFAAAAAELGPEPAENDIDGWLARPVYWFRCVTADGRELELMHHEVELARW